MPMTELQGWLDFYKIKAERDQQAERRSGSVNLLDLEPEQLAKAFSHG